MKEERSISMIIESSLDNYFKKRSKPLSEGTYNLLKENAKRQYERERDKE